MPENDTKEETHFETIRISVLPSGNAQILPDSPSEGHEEVTHNVSVLTSDDIPGANEKHTDLGTDQNHNILEEQTIHSDQNQNTLHTETTQSDSKKEDSDEAVIVDPKKRLADIDKRVEDINDKLKDLQEELTKGKFVGLL